MAETLCFTCGKPITCDQKVAICSTNCGAVSHRNCIKPKTNVLRIKCKECKGKRVRDCSCSRSTYHARKYAEIQTTNEELKIMVNAQMKMLSEANTKVDKLREDIAKISELGTSFIEGQTEREREKEVRTVSPEVVTEPTAGACIMPEQATTFSPNQEEEDSDVTSTDSEYLPMADLTVKSLIRTNMICTICQRKIDQRSPNNTKLHKTLLVLICKKCLSASEQIVPKGDQCIWCWKTCSDFIRCSNRTCLNRLCERCVKNNFRSHQRKRIMLDVYRDSWQCLSCSPEQTEFHRSVAQAAHLFGNIYRKPLLSMVGDPGTPKDCVQDSEGIAAAFVPMRVEYPSPPSSVFSNDSPTESVSILTPAKRSRNEEQAAQNQEVYDKETDCNAELPRRPQISLNGLRPTSRICQEDKIIFNKSLHVTIYDSDDLEEEQVEEEVEDGDVGAREDINSRKKSKNIADRTIRSDEEENVAEAATEAAESHITYEAAVKIIRNSLSAIPIENVVIDKICDQIHQQLTQKSSQSVSETDAQEKGRDSCISTSTGVMEGAEEKEATGRRIEQNPCEEAPASTCVKQEPEDPPDDDVSIIGISTSTPRRQMSLLEAFGLSERCVKEEIAKSKWVIDISSDEEFEPPPPPTRGERQPPEDPGLQQSQSVDMFNTSMRILKRQF